MTMKELHTKQFVYESALAPGWVLSQRPLNQWKDVLKSEKDLPLLQPFKADDVMYCFCI